MGKDKNRVRKRTSLHLFLPIPPEASLSHWHTQYTLHTQHSNGKYFLPPSVFISLPPPNGLALVCQITDTPREKKGVWKKKELGRRVSIRLFAQNCWKHSAVTVTISHTLQTPLDDVVSIHPRLLIYFQASTHFPLRVAGCVNCNYRLEKHTLNTP